MKNEKKNRERERIIREKKMNNECFIVATSCQREIVPEVILYYYDVY